MATDKVTTSVLTRLQKRAEEAQNRLDQRAAETPKQLFLPGMEDFMRAMPNSIARSSLFAPIARGKRKYHQATILVSRVDAKIEYSGEQLDEADADIMLQLMFESRHSALGEPVEFTRASFLRSLGKTDGKNNYEWLDRRITALTKATIIVETYKPDGQMKYKLGHRRGFHILSGFDVDEETGVYTFTIDPRWATLFGNREYALLDWTKRLAIAQGQDMAKTLQRLIATSADITQRYALEWLKDKLQYTGRTRDFKQALDRSINELKRVGIIINGRIELNSRKEEQLTVQILK
jgi:hypothetical protein